MSDNNKNRPSLLDIAGVAVGGLSTIGGWLGIGEKRQDKRQVAQQEKLNAVNATTAKELADYEQGLKMKMWQDTNYAGQLKQADLAGVSKAAVLGGSGTGTQGASVSGVSGGGAADAAATANAKTQMMAQGMQLASQLALLKAQKENIEADTANKKAGATGQQVKTEGEQIDVNIKKTTQEDAIKKIKAEAETAIEEMWLKTNDRTLSDHTLKDRVKLVATELLGKIADNKNTDADTKRKEAETVVAQFNAKMAEEGISTNAPWYTKMLMDALKKFGISPITIGKAVVQE